MGRDFYEFSQSLSGSCPIASFPNGGFVAFSGNSIHILRSFSLLRDHAEYDQHIKCNPVPGVADSADINRITVSDDGLRVSISGTKFVYVVTLSPETLASKTSSVEVFCECLSIDTSFLQRNSTTVAEVKFVRESLYSGLSFAVLCSDNNLRFYNITSVNKRPIAVVDFNKYVHGGSNALDNTFGLYNTLVSFDFILTDSRLCVLTVDNEGQLYTAIVTENEPPLIRTVISPAGLPCDPTALFNVSNPFCKIFSVFAMFSPINDGVLAHFIILPSENGGFEAILQEKIRMPTPTKEVVFVPSHTPSTYLLGSPNRLYLVDIRPWVSIYGSQLLKSYSQSSLLPDSKMHIAAANLEESSAFAPTFGQTAVVNCKSDDMTITLLISRFSTQSLLTSFLRNEFMGEAGVNASHVGKKGISFKESAVDPVLSKAQILSRITGGSGKDTKQGLKEFEEWCNKLSSNLDLNKTATQLTMKRVANFASQVVSSSHQKQEINERLLNLLNDFTKCQDEVAKRKKSLETLANRIVSLSTRASQMRPLTVQEKRMLGTLKDYRKQVCHLNGNISQLSISVNEEKRSLFGPAKSFQPSGSSFRSSIDRNSCEIDSLMSRVSKIASRVGCDE